MATRPNLTGRLVNAWYGVLWLMLLIALIYMAIRGDLLTSPPLMISLGLFVIFSVLAVRATTRLFACLAFITLFAPFYLFDAYLLLTDVPSFRSSKVAYIAKLRQQSIAAYPAVFPSGFLYLAQGDSDNDRSQIVIEGREILPLAGIPEVLTVYCQAEDLSVITYRSDAFGFRNMTVSSPRKTPKFALLGDSFVQGWCVPEPFTYAAQLSVLGPSVSYGMNGTAALTQLAIFREYVKPLRPRHVIWFFYEDNDVGEYLGERVWPPLQAYLKRGYLQDLVRLNGYVSVAMKRFIDQQLDSVEVATIAHDRHQKRSVWSEMVDFALLRRARTVLGLMREPHQPTDLTETEWREIRDIWREVIEAQHRRRGKITFVYIPSRSHFLAHDSIPLQALERKVEALWSGLNVDYISLTAPIEAAENPLALYDPYDGHFNEKGYRLTGDAIIKHLRPSAPEG